MADLRYVTSYTRFDGELQNSIRLGTGDDSSPAGSLFRRFFRRFDIFQIAPMILLLATGLAFIYGTGRQVGDSNAYDFWLRQCAYMGVGFAIWFALIFFDYRWLGPGSLIIYPASVALLICVLAFGKEYYGAKRWLSIGSTSLQPSELAKVAVILSLSWLLSLKKADINKPLWAILAVVLVAIPFILIFKQPDLGTALVLIPATGAIIFAAKLKFRYIAIIIICASVAAPITYSLLKPYQKDRISTFLDPDRDPRNRGWNANQAKMAVGRGGISGQGYMRGTHCSLGYLPRTVANSDFIFPVIAEETGFSGCIMLLTLYAALLYSIFRTALIAPDAFGRYICTGVGALVTFHAGVNIAMCTGLAPITGLPLPLVSFGGTFMVSTMTYLGLVQSVYAHRNSESFLDI